MPENQILLFVCVPVLHSNHKSVLILYTHFAKQRTWYFFLLQDQGYLILISPFFYFIFYTKSTFRLQMYLQFLPDTYSCVYSILPLYDCLVSSMHQSRYNLFPSEMKYRAAIVFHDDIKAPLENLRDKILQLLPAILQTDFHGIGNTLFVYAHLLPIVPSTAQNLLHRLLLG